MHCFVFIFIHFCLSFYSRSFFSFFTFLLSSFSSFLCFPFSLGSQSCSYEDVLLILCLGQTFFVFTFLTFLTFLFFFSSFFTYLVFLVPTKPGRFRVTSTKDSSVTFQWDKPLSTGSKSIAYHILCPGISNHSTADTFIFFKIVSSQSKMTCTVIICLLILCCSVV